jgi:hypothetical protein
MHHAWPLLLFVIALPAHACWQDAARRYGVDAQLLYAIAQHESNLNPHAINRSHAARTGSIDIGLMQINSRWLPLLARHGLREADLLEPCLNLQVGAWILAQVSTQRRDLGSRRGLPRRLLPIVCARLRRHPHPIRQRRVPASPGDRAPPDAIAASPVTRYPVRSPTHRLEIR